MPIYKDGRELKTEVLHVKIEKSLFDKLQIMAIEGSRKFPDEVRLALKRHVEHENDG